MMNANNAIVLLTIGSTAVYAYLSQEDRIDDIARAGYFDQMRTVLQIGDIILANSARATKCWAGRFKVCDISADGHVRVSLEPQPAV